MPRGQAGELTQVCSLGNRVVGKDMILATAFKGWFQIESETNALMRCFNVRIFTGLTASAPIVSPLLSRFFLCISDS